MNALQLILGLVTLAVIAASGYGLFVFFGFIGPVLLLALLIPVVGTILFFANSGTRSSGTPRQRQSKGARQGRD